MKCRIFTLFIWMSLSFLYGEAFSNSNEFHPIDLISPKRADLMAKYIYAKHREWETKSFFGFDIYYRHLQVWNGFEEYPHKLSFDDFQKAFNELLDSIKNNEFNSSSPVSIGTAGIVYSGAHRLVSCLLYDKLVQVERVPAECDYGFAFFKSRNLESKYLDAMALQYCELKSDSYILIVFPSAVGRNDEVEDILNTYATIVYKKEVGFTKRGGMNFILTAYENKSFINAPHKVERKVTSSFPERLLKFNKARVYLLQCKNLQLLKECKAKIRALFRLSKNSVHSTDTHLEAVILARALFNDNSIHCLNHRKDISSPIFDHCLEGYRAWLALNTKESEWCCIDEDAVLAAYGLKDSNDLSFLFYKNEVPILNIPRIENNNHQLKYYATSLDDILFDPENYFFYKGVKFCTLSVLRKMKECRGEMKDISDLLLINNVQTTNP